MRVVFAVFGSLGDMHPMNAIGLELQRRGHEVAFATMEFYREKITTLGFEFIPMRPHFTLEGEENRALAARLMDPEKGSELLIREIILPNLRPMYEDLTEAVRGADLLISTEIVFAAPIVAEQTGIRWATTSLAPGPLMSAHDPFVPPIAPWFRHLRFLGSTFHGFVVRYAGQMIDEWCAPYHQFRAELGLPPGKSPIISRSEQLNLAMFSRVLGAPQPDWPTATLQTGFCFYDGDRDLGPLEPELASFLEHGAPPIVFTLGSAAVLDAGDFYEQSAAAAQKLGRRAVLLYGLQNEPPKVAPDANICAVPYAPYAQLFPRAACVVHQGGVGTTSQVLRAGVPQLVVPYAHDQIDNAARCERLGVGKFVMRRGYDADVAAARINRLLATADFAVAAREKAAIIGREHGTHTAAEALEALCAR